MVDVGVRVGEAVTVGEGEAVGITEGEGVAVNEGDGRTGVAATLLTTAGAQPEMNKPNKVNRQANR